MPKFTDTMLFGYCLEYRYQLRRTWRPTVELTIYQKTEKHAHSLFFNRISVKKNFQKLWDINKFTLIALIPINFEVMDNVLNSRLERVNKKLLTSASLLYLISLKSIFFVLLNLQRLQLDNINLTAKPAAAIARSLHQALSLSWLCLSNNPLGEGVSVLTWHFSSVPRLDTLWPDGVRMTKQQVSGLSAAVRQIKIFLCETQYHVSFMILVCICSHYSCLFCSISCGVVLRIFYALSSRSKCDISFAFIEQG